MQDACETTTSGHRDRRSETLGGLHVLPDETICFILEYLSPRDIARLACASSVMYILCNEEPLWLSLCLKRAKGPLQCKGSWKNTTLYLEGVTQEHDGAYRKPLHFNGFNSLYLYKRFYRCHTSLDGFSFDDGNVERKRDLSLDEFSKEYDAKKPVLIAGLAESWPARSTWTVDQLTQKYGETAFRISQRSPNKISMKFKDYVSYMNIQRDEDPLYVFDDKFGEVATDLLKDYSVPHLFREDWFDILDHESRPSYRWLIVGPERSGASWHVDPALTSAWNTLLCGRKRWALYPPGRVPLGVTVHVNEDDGDVNIDTPSSLQWWLDYYPLLADEDKPIECTQLPGETIYVPSGWWHCVLNIETTVAVTQNFVNENNFEFVCLDMAPGYRHKGVCRAGLLALDESSLEEIEIEASDEVKDTLSYADLTRKEKRIRINRGEEMENHEGGANGVSKRYHVWKNGFSYDIDFLASFLDKDRDHYNFPWCMGNSIGQREMREWLFKLWVLKPEMRKLIWKGACVALNSEKWLHCLEEICNFHALPSITDEEKLPVGTGSNPVYLLSDHVVKLYVEGGLEQSMYGLGTELEFYDVLGQADSPLKTHVPDVLASGILFLENGSYRIVPWDGKRIPDVIAGCNLGLDAVSVVNGEFPFGIWSKTLIERRNLENSNQDTFSSSGTHIWPYIITKRCKGKIFAQLDELSWEDAMNLASFLGEQVRNLHLLPYPPIKFPLDGNDLITMDVQERSNIPAEWRIFVGSLCQKKKDVFTRLEKWGSPIPRQLIDKVNEYIPDEFFTDLLCVYKDKDCVDKAKPCTWIHSDIMDDNIHMEPSLDDDDDSINCQNKTWRPSHILDFSNLSIGDPIYELIPIYLDVFRGDGDLLKKLLESYKLPLVRSRVSRESPRDKELKLSYRAMCYCILHEENVLGAIFGIWDELRSAESWEDVEFTVWGLLNSYSLLP
ncbi:PREDICTED: F-box protein At1g78280 isoform X2 [Tarenaya hassleriana]|uniref:F-box protein At1g78280 isoform X2 n=1 Tax=Tarenaya hassleriana TaxID=28532 RepID=UPI00053C097A|nr:PREDICTED: F-box protein At1g78280 isoform X2 [Tarenaya hassleriana]